MRSILETQQIARILSAKRLREDFDFNDLNKDGRLTLGEFIRFMESMDENMTAEECQIGFDEIDRDRDGAIKFDEFVAWWTQD